MELGRTGSEVGRDPVWACGAARCGRSIVVGVTGFKLTISMCSLIR